MVADSVLVADKDVLAASDLLARGETTTVVLGLPSGSVVEASTCDNGLVVCPTREP